ncbi:MAG: tol-pal system YbgF family protein [Acidobacteriota bacterium]
MRSLRRPPHALGRLAVRLTAWLALILPSAALAQGYGGTVYDILVRGDILLSRGMYNEAIAQFQEARTLCPTPDQTVTSLQGEGRARLAMGEILPAAGLFEEAATRFPDDPRVPDLLRDAGGACHRAGQYDRAADLLRRALESGPTTEIIPSIRFQLAQALRLRGRNAEVVDLLADFESRYPRHPLLPMVLYTLAIAHHDLRNYEPSEALYRSILERFPGTQAATESYYELGSVLADAGRPREAAGFFEQYVDLNPGSPVAARALERAGDMLLLRSPRRSAELYALARVKAEVNPEPPNPTLRISRWLASKRRVAGLLSRIWLVALLGLGAAGALAAAARWILGRLRRHLAAKA